MAPEPDDIHWSLVTVHPRTRLLISLFTWAFFIVLILFWAVPVGFAQALANLSTLSQIRALRWLVNIIEFNQQVAYLIQGFLPALVLIIFQSFLPDIIGAVLKLKGVYTRSQLEKELMNVFFVFQVVNVLLFTTALTGLVTVRDGNLEIGLVQAAVSVGSQSGFFINYLIVYGLSSCPKDLLRLGPVLINLLRRFHHRKEVKQSEQLSMELDQPESFRYGYRYTNALLLFVLTFSFSTIAPLILPFGVLALVMEYLVCKYHHVYTSNQQFHSGARIWPSIFTRMLVGVAIYQILMICILTLKGFSTGGFPLIAVMPLATFAFGRWADKRFFKLSRFLAITDSPPEEQPETDLGDSTGYTAEKMRYSYRDPGLTD